MKKIPFLLLFLMIFSCENSTEIDKSLLEYTGFYKIDYYYSEKPVDLNNDGIFNNDLMKEINFYFSNSPNEIEIRPTIYQSIDAKLISFSFPKTYLKFYSSNKLDYELNFIAEMFGTSYEFNRGKFILRTTDFNEYGKIKDFEYNSSSHFPIKLKIQKNYYNFEINDWEELNVEVKYIKID